MYRVRKRDGKYVAFSLAKIHTAITMAFEAQKRQYSEDVIELLALRVTADFEPKIKDNAISVEEIQDSVETVLSRTGYEDIAKSYILYRKQHETIRNMHATMLDYKTVVDSYVKEADWRVKENSTVTYSVGGLILSNSGAITANYWLTEAYDAEIARAHRDADLHLHDLSMLTGYCAGWSLRQLILDGLGGIPGKITSSPARHLATLCNQMVNFLGIMQNEWAGAQAFSSFDTYLAPFVKIDNLAYDTVKKCIESFIYGVNTPSRWGTQAPFSNITLDWTVPKDLADQPAIVGGKLMDFTYRDCQPEMDMVNRAFIEIMLEGDAHGRGFQYPIPTYSITKNFDWSETENNKLLFEMTAKYGTPYFSNYVNSDMQPDDVRSMCPLHGSEQVLMLANDENFCNLTSIDEMYGWQKMGWFGADPVYTLLHRGKKIKAKLKVFPNQAFLKVTLENGVSIRLSTNHQNLTLEHGVVPTDQLTTEDYLPFNIDKYTSTHPEDCHDVTSTLGQLVGWYLQYGVFAKGGRVKFYVPNEQIAQAIYATGQIEHAARNHYYVYDDLKRGEKKRYKALQPKFTASACLVEMECDNLNIALSNHVYTLDTKRMLTGNYLESSEEFRQGILSTWPVETGGRWTVASEHVDTIRTLLASLGRALIAKAQDDGTSKLTVFSADTTSKKCRFDDQKQYIWFKIKSIENEDEYGNGYCFEVQEPNEPYFMLPSGLITHNCRLRLDLRELRKKSGGYFGSGESTGSVGVVTINMPRIAYLAKDEADFYSRLGKLMDIAARSLKIKRKVITKLLEGGLYPYTKHYLGTFANHFSTIGLVGMNEVGLNAKWLGKDMTDPKTQAFARDVLNFMRNRLSDYQEQYGDLYNLEATPAESTSYRLAKHDVERYPDIKTAAGSGTKENRTPYYTNSSHLPVGYTDDIFTSLDAQDELQTLYTSGTVFHAFLGEKLSGWKAAATLVRRIAEQYKLPYYTLSPTYSICHQHGYLAGEVYTCPHCGETTEIYSRVTGYYRPVGNWNAGKSQEFKDRKVYQLDSTVESYENTPTEHRAALS